MPALSPHISPLRKKLEDPNTIASVLLTILVDRWGVEFFNWEPETLALQARSDFGADIPQNNRDKIWALVTYLTTDRFTKNLDLFTHVCNALSDSGADFQNYDPATVQEIAWCIAEISLLEPMEEELAPEIKLYIDTALESEGFMQPPRILKQYVSEPAPEDEVNSALAMDEIDFKAYWDGQALKRGQVDEYIRDRLHQLLQDVARLPLSNADDQARSQLLERAGKALEAQSKQTAQELEPVPQRPFQ
jgi:hypothetical protein